MTRGAGADAVIFPLRENFLEALQEALQYQHARGRLYSNGERLAWLPGPRAGWDRIDFAQVREVPCAA